MSALLLSCYAYLHWTNDKTQVPSTLSKVKQQCLTAGLEMWMHLLPIATCCWATAPPTLLRGLNVVIDLLYLAYQCPLKLKGLPRNYSVKIFNIKIHFYLIAHKPSQYILWNGVSYQLSKHQIMKPKIW